MSIFFGSSLIVCMFVLIIFVKRLFLCSDVDSVC